VVRWETRQTDAVWTDWPRIPEDRGLGALRARRGHAASRRGANEMVRAWMRTIAAAPSPTAVRTRHERVIDSLAPTLPAVGAMVAGRCAPSRASRRPTGARSGRYTRLGACTHVAGVFPNDAALLRLVTAGVLAQDEEWVLAQGHYLFEDSMAQIGAHQGHDDSPGTPETLSRARSPQVLARLAEAAPEVVGERRPGSE